MSNIYELFNTTNDKEFSNVISKFNLTSSQLTQIYDISINGKSLAEQIEEVKLVMYEKDSLKSYNTYCNLFKTKKQRTLKEDVGTISLNQMLSINETLSKLFKRAQSLECVQELNTQIIKMLGQQAGTTVINFVNSDDTDLNFDTSGNNTSLQLLNILPTLQTFVDSFEQQEPEVKKKDEEEEQLEESAQYNDFNYNIGDMFLTQRNRAWEIESMTETSVTFRSIVSSRTFDLTKSEVLEMLDSDFLKYDDSQDSGEFWDGNELMESASTKLRAGTSYVGMVDGFFRIVTLKATYINDNDIVKWYVEVSTYDSEKKYLRGDDCNHNTIIELTESNLQSEITKHNLITLKEYDLMNNDVYWDGEEDLTESLNTLSTQIETADNNTLEQILKTIDYNIKNTESIEEQNHLTMLKSRIESKLAEIHLTSNTEEIAECLDPVLSTILDNDMGSKINIEINYNNNNDDEENVAHGDLKTLAHSTNYNTLSMEQLQIANASLARLADYFRRKLVENANPSSSNLPFKVGDLIFGRDGNYENTIYDIDIENDVATLKFVNWVSEEMRLGFLKQLILAGEVEIETPTHYTSPNPKYRDLFNFTNMFVNKATNDKFSIINFIEVEDVVIAECVSTLNYKKSIPVEDFIKEFESYKIDIYIHTPSLKSGDIITNVKTGERITIVQVLEHRDQYVLENYNQEGYETISEVESKLFRKEYIVNDQPSPDGDKLDDTFWDGGDLTESVDKNHEIKNGNLYSTMRGFLFITNYDKDTNYVDFKFEDNLGVGNSKPINDFLNDINQERIIYIPQTKIKVGDYFKFADKDEVYAKITKIDLKERDVEFERVSNKSIDNIQYGNFQFSLFKNKIEIADSPDESLEDDFWDGSELNEMLYDFQKSEMNFQVGDVYENTSDGDIVTITILRMNPNKHYDISFKAVSSDTGFVRSDFNMEMAPNKLEDLIKGKVNKKSYELVGGPSSKLDDDFWDGGEQLNEMVGDDDLSELYQNARWERFESNNLEVGNIFKSTGSELTRNGKETVHHIYKITKNENRLVHYDIEKWDEGFTTILSKGRNFLPSNTLVFKGDEMLVGINDPLGNDYWDGDELMESSQLNDDRRMELYLTSQWKKCSANNVVNIGDIYRKMITFGDAHPRYAMFTIEEITSDEIIAMCEYWSTNIEKYIGSFKRSDDKQKFENYFTSCEKLVPNTVGFEDDFWDGSEINETRTPTNWRILYKKQFLEKGWQITPNHLKGQGTGELINICSKYQLTSDNSNVFIENPSDDNSRFYIVKKTQVNENASVGATSAGCVAMVSQPIGSVKTRKAKKPKKVKEPTIESYMFFKGIEENNDYVAMNFDGVNFKYKVLEGNSYLFMDDKILKTNNKETIKESLEDYMNGEFNGTLLEGITPMMLDIILEEDDKNMNTDLTNRVYILPNSKNPLVVAEDDGQNLTIYKLNRDYTFDRSSGMGHRRSKREFLNELNPTFINTVFLLRRDYAEGKDSAADYWNDNLEDDFWDGN